MEISADNSSISCSTEVQDGPEKNIKREISSNFKCFNVEAVLGPEYSAPVSTVDVLVDVIVDKRHTSRLVQELSRLSPIPSLRHLKRVCPDGRILIKLADDCSKDNPSITINSETKPRDKIEPETKDTSMCSAVKCGSKRTFCESSSSEIQVDPKTSGVLNCGNVTELHTSDPIPSESDLLLQAERSETKLLSLHVDKGKLQCPPGLDTQGLRGELKCVSVPSSPPLTRWQYEEAQHLWSCNFHPARAVEAALAPGAGLSDRELKVLQSIVEQCFEAAEKSGVETAACALELKTGRNVALSLDGRRTHPLQHAAMRLVDLVARTQGGGVWSPLLGETLKGSSSDTCRSDSSQYLCTGLDVFVLREPCAMCAMALTHARVRRVFFCELNSTQGVLYSNKPLFHTLPGLNHRLNVFRVSAPTSSSVT